MKLFRKTKQDEHQQESEELIKARMNLHNPKSYSTLDGFLSTRPLELLRPRRTRWEGISWPTIIEEMQKEYGLDEETVLEIIWVEYVNRVGVEAAYNKAKQDIIEIYDIYDKDSRRRRQLTTFRFETVARDFNWKCEFNTFKRPDKSVTIEALIHSANYRDCYPLKIIKELIIEMYLDKFDGIVLRKALELLHSTFDNYRNRCNLQYHQNYVEYLDAKSEHKSVS